ncbi:MAG: hypothetical protein GX112_08655 [Clostridiaceae bacterium]|nr:hypothetical protein [Clostridiaceae bacterium]
MIDNQTFTQRHASRLDDFVRMSRLAGGASDYVQGGGGNTSCKVDDTLMAIKASGFRLDQIGQDQAYAVLDFQSLRQFYLGTDPRDLADIEQEGSARAKASIRLVDGLPALRPSVEAGFHAILDTFVLHTHPVYANLATCAAQGPAIAAAALADLPVSHAFVPYINPGAQLTFAIRQAIGETEAKTGRKPAILLMQNHGLVVTGPDADTCLNLHEEANRCLAAAFGVSRQDWPAVEVRPESGQDDGQHWVSATPWLGRQLQTRSWDHDFFAVQSLYPDQLVFLGGKIAVLEPGAPVPEGIVCTLDRASGEVRYRCGFNEARTIEETLCAVLFITQTIQQAGHTVRLMSEDNRSFISNWESEKYRKSITAQ